jgi:hypothetical protein
MKTRLRASGGISCSYKFTAASGYLTNKLYSNGVRAQYAYDAIGRMTGLIHARAAGLRFAQQ